MADELWDTLMRFHREVAFPEIVGTLHEEIATRHRETQANFDGVWTRLDRLESEYHALSAAMTRVEATVARLEDKQE
jgi:predicted nuclease with TOPRIM domain